MAAAFGTGRCSNDRARNRRNESRISGINYAGGSLRTPAQKSEVLQTIIGGTWSSLIWEYAGRSGGFMRFSACSTPHLYFDRIGALSGRSRPTLSQVH